MPDVTSGGNKALHDRLGRSLPDGGVGRTTSVVGSCGVTRGGRLNGRGLPELVMSPINISLAAQTSTLSKQRLCSTMLVVRLSCARCGYTSL